MRDIYVRLDAAKDQAFSRQELVNLFGLSEEPKTRPSIEHEEWYKNKTRFSLALEKLVQLNAVSEREVAGVAYYATGRYALDDVLDGKVDPYKPSRF